MEPLPGILCGSINAYTYGTSSTVINAPNVFVIVYHDARSIVLYLLPAAEVSKTVVTAVPGGGGGMRLCCCIVSRALRAAACPCSAAN